VKPIFIPLLLQSILYIGSIENASVAPGIIGEHVDPLTILIPRAARSLHASQPLRMFDPQGNETKFSVSLLDPKGSTVLAEWLSENAVTPGFYTVTEGRDTITAAGMNISPAESDGTVIPAREMLGTIEHYGGTPTLLSPAGSIETVVMQSRFGVELWKYFLFFALVIALIEMLVAREAHE
jgi:hypothetical protein